MFNLLNRNEKTNTHLAINVVKISIIIFVGVWLIGNFEPYYLGADAFVYGITSIGLTDGSFGFTNDLLQETGSWNFVPYQWSKTNDNTLIPNGDVGIYGLSTLSYLLGGYYGLFYLGPIITIFLLIIVDRIATKLFGNLVGLLTLAFLATNFIILWIGSQLRNDNLFAIFFILGCFYLIKFFKDKKSTSILLCSIFFAIGTFIRINGIIAFPLEIVLILGYFGFNYYTQVKNEPHPKNISYLMKNLLLKISKRDFLKKISYLLIPWIIFFIFILSFNQYYYGDPLTNYFDERPATPDYITASKYSFLEFDLHRLNWMSFYSNSIIPDTLKSFIFNIFLPESEDKFGDNALGIFSAIILISSLAISLHYRIKRIEIIILISFIMVYFFFYSASYLHSIDLNFESYQPTTISRDRYMLPLVPLSAMIFGFLIHSIWKFHLKDSTSRFSINSKILKGVFLIILISFGVTAFMNSTPVEALKASKFEMKDPVNYANRYPLDMEGLSKADSIIVEGKRYGIEYNATSFYPFWGYWPKFQYEFNYNSIPQEPVEHLKKLMDDNYNVYAFKHRFFFETMYFQYLENQHGLYLKEHSDLFCKLENSKETNDSDDASKHDSECYPGNNSRKIPTLKKFMDVEEPVIEGTSILKKNVSVEFQFGQTLNEQNITKNETTLIGNYSFKIPIEYILDEETTFTGNYSFIVPIEDILEEFP